MGQAVRASTALLKGRFSGIVRWGFLDTTAGVTAALNAKRDFLVRL